MRPALGQDRKLDTTTPTLSPAGPPPWPFLCPAFEAQWESYWTHITIIKSPAIVVILSVVA